MAAIVLANVICVTVLPLPVLGDEGMFMPDAIARLPLDKLKKRGLKIPLTDIYNPSGLSIKDAIVIVDGGTGEFVSPEGLLLTNHHVAFDALVSASDPAKDYANNGYKATSRADELPAKGYTVTITQELKDVTSEILNGVNESMSPGQRNMTISQRVEQMELGGQNQSEGITVSVEPMNEGLSYYKFTYLVLRDVRIVYAPPKNIGAFGGDPDNFEWPRHDGDFTFMRAYVGANGKPADYSANNVPYKPRKFLPLSLNGVREGDFMMVLGYPGQTRRYRESYSVAYNQDIVLPFSIELLSRQIDSLKEVGKYDSNLRLSLESRMAGLSNSLKNFAGSEVGMRHAGIVDKKRTEEGAFTLWLNAEASRKVRYGEVLPSLRKAYDELLRTARSDLILGEMDQASTLMEIVSFAQLAAAEKEKPAAERNLALGPAAIQEVRAGIPTALAERLPTVERDMLKFLLQKADELPAGQKIDFIEKRFANLKGEARRRAEEDYVRAIVDSKKFSTESSLAGLLDLSTAQLSALDDPLPALVWELTKLQRESRRRTQTFNASVFRWRPLLVTGMSEMKNSQPYPDANRTLRFTYGEVKGYTPHEAVTASPFTTLAGVIEKDTGREPFDVPEKLKQLFRARDFGQYATADKANVPVNFLSDTDIIGGNSGSPILNGSGEQVGIIFDSNYEGLGNDFFYNAEKGRAIAVDIRYVLFVTDKFGEAGYLLKELDLRGQQKVRAAASGKK